MLKVSGLSIAFGARVVDDISFDIREGEVLALVGESGSGKSITALSLMGLLPPNATVTGDIKFDGEMKVGRDMTMVFQEPMTALNPLHTIGKQIGEMIAIHNKDQSRDQISKRVLELLDQVGLTYLSSRLNAYPHQLSGGERQRVMIAIAMANNPKLLIADEPTTAVDVTIQHQILELLKKLQRERKLSVLLITHDLTIVRKIADRVAIMQKGKLVEVGKTADIFAAPKHPYTQHLLASEPKGAPEPCAKDAKTVVKAHRLSVHFPLTKGIFFASKEVKKAVDDVSLFVRAGETLGVVGESGSGKSTLAFALLKLVNSMGEIAFEGKPIEHLTRSQMRPLRRNMQIVFQDPFSSLNPRMTVEDIVLEGLRVHEKKSSDAALAAQLNAVLNEVGLSPDMKTRYAHEFSGGQRQRIAIARAMILKPKFVILDEPTSALDLTIQAQIIELLKDLQKKHGLAYMFISHDLRTVKAISHRIVVMKNGEIVESGDSKNIFDAPQQDYTKRLIHAAFAAA